MNHDQANEDWMVGSTPAPKKQMFVVTVTSNSPNENVGSTVIIPNLASLVQKLTRSLSCLSCANTMAGSLSVCIFLIK